MSIRLNWGEHIWHSMHFVAMGYPEPPTPSDRDAYRVFYTKIPDVLPCRKCAPHFREIIERIPIEPYLLNRKQLFTWTVLAHNEVNKSLGKPAWSVERAWSVYSGEESFDVLEPSRPSPAEKPPKNKLLLLLAILLIITVAVTVVYSRLPARYAKINRTK